MRISSTKNLFDMPQLSQYSFGLTTIHLVAQLYQQAFNLIQSILKYYVIRTFYDNLIILLAIIFNDANK